MLNKEKYKNELEDILFNSLAVTINGDIEECKNICDCCEECIFYNGNCGGYEEAKKWLNSEYKESILTDEEREYLRAVIEPFKKYVMYIAKLDFKVGWEKIVFYSQSFKTWECMTDLPPFQSGTRFKGIELNEHYYKLEELGL